MALGKQWDWTSEGGDATGAQLESAWLRAEQAKELTVLRAQQVQAALRWLLGLATSEGLLVRLVSPEPFGELTGDDRAVVETEVPMVASRVRGRHDGGPRCGDEHTDPCEDLNCPAPLPSTVPPGLTPATARRLWRLHDIEAAALATATVLLGRFDPRSVAVARQRVSPDATSAVRGRPAKGPCRGPKGRSRRPGPGVGCAAAGRAAACRLRATSQPRKRPG
jgi:hypothetical protein